MDGASVDTICGGRVRIAQPLRGYRVNLDPVLLAHFAADWPARGAAIDLGTGSAVIPLILARKFGWPSVTGLELQPQLYALARANVRLNACEHRVSLALGDLRRIDRVFPREAFAHVLCNPPYRAVSRGPQSRDPERAGARHDVHASLSDVARAARFLLRDRGALHLVFPASRLGELVSALRAERLEPRRLRLVHPRSGRPARLALITAVKSGAPDLCVLPPLVVHGALGFSEEVQAMLGAKDARAPASPASV